MAGEQNLIYGNFWLNALSGNIASLSGGTQKLKVALLKRTHTLNQAKDSWNDVKSDEITDADYSQKEITVNISYADRIMVIEGPAECSLGSEVTITAGYAVIYDGRPATDAARKLMCIIDFGKELSSVDGVFRLDFAKVGLKYIIIRNTVAAPAE